MVIQGVSYASDFEAKKAMIELGKRMAEKAYVIAEDGSMSVRVGPNAVWITARGASCANLTQNDFVRVDLNGKQMFSAHPRPLPEDLPVHLKVYTTNPQMQSVVHAYPVEVAVLTAQGRDVQPAAYTPACGCWLPPQPMWWRKKPVWPVRPIAGCCCREMAASCGGLRCARLTINWKP